MLAPHSTQRIRDSVIALVSFPISQYMPTTLAQHFASWSLQDWVDSFTLADNEGLANWYLHRVDILLDGNCPGDLLGAQRAKTNAAKVWAKFQAVLSTDVYYALQKAKIDSRVYKGVALAKAIYGDATLRNSSDIDILVAPKDLRAAVQALKSTGFETPLDERWLEHPQFLQGAREMQLSSMHDSFTVDLHWRLMCNWNGVGPVSEDELFSGVAPELMLAHASLPWFAPSTLFRLQLAHVISSSWRGLKTFVDLAHVFDNLDVAAQIDVVQICRQRGCSDALWAALGVLQAIFGRDAPSMAAMCQPPVGDIRRWSLFADECCAMLRTRPSSAPTSMEIARIAWQTRSHWTVSWQVLQRLWTPTVFDYIKIDPGARFSARMGRAALRHFRKNFRAGA